VARDERADERRRRPGSPRARLFLALDPPEEARAALAAWRAELCAGRDDLRLPAAATLHVTLVFLGWQPEKAVEAIAEQASAAVAGHGPVELAPAGVEPVPPRRPRLFALDLADPGGACAALQADAERALAEGGWHRPERRAFWPHVTLARVKRDRRAAPLEPAGPLPAAFRAADVVLYRSILEPAGARYEALARVRLGRASSE
jgi:2'-5' RNA ligase